MHWVARNNRLGAMKWLKRQGADLYAVENVGLTPMDRVPFFSDPEIIRWMREQGVDPGVQGEGARKRPPHPRRCPGPVRRRRLRAGSIPFTPSGNENRKEA